MSDRDDLVKILAPQFPKFALWTLEFVADQILAAGWRPATVTPEKIEAAAATLAYRARGTWQGSEDYWRMVARESAETFGLSVAEDGGQ